MRSCLRSALVPAISRPRASLPSSAMLFSFNSVIVMGFLVGFRSSGGIWGLRGCRGAVRRLRAQGVEREHHARGFRAGEETEGITGRSLLRYHKYQKLRDRREHSPEKRRGRRSGLLGRAANRCHSLYGLFRARNTHRDGILEAIQHLVGGVLKAGVRLVKLAGRLGSELAELVAVVDVCEGSKNQV